MLVVAANLLFLDLPTAKETYSNNVRPTKTDLGRDKAILDTGAPWTETSDEFLHNAGIPGTVTKNISIPAGLQTQRYGKLVLPEIGICGQTLSDMEVKVARFDESWGVDALIGLNFFRRFPVTIDYQRGVVEVG